MLHSQLKSLVQPPADVIEKLMLLSFKISKLDARPPRPTGVYSINDESQEEWTRSAVFGRFVKTPGPHTYHAIRRLQADPSFAVSPARMNALAEERAIEDADSAPWPPGEAYAFEQSAQNMPRTGKDLQGVLIGRIEDIQHDLLRGDYSQSQNS